MSSKFILCLLISLSSLLASTAQTDDARTAKCDASFRQLKRDADQITHDAEKEKEAYGDGHGGDGVFAIRGGFWGLIGALKGDPTLTDRNKCFVWANHIYLSLKGQLKPKLDVPGCHFKATLYNTMGPCGRNDEQHFTVLVLYDEVSRKKSVRFYNFFDGDPTLRALEIPPDKNGLYRIWGIPMSLDIKNGFLKLDYAQNVNSPVLRKKAGEEIQLFLGADFSGATHFDPQVKWVPPSSTSRSPLPVGPQTGSGSHKLE